MGKVPFDEELWEAQRWCIRNDIAIAPKCKNDTAWYITIKNKDKVNTSPLLMAKQKYGQKYLNTVNTILTSISKLFLLI